MKRIIGGIAVLLFCCLIFSNTILVEAAAKSKQITVEYVDDIFFAESTKPCRYTPDELGMNEEYIEKLEPVDGFADYSDMSQYISCHFVLKEPSYVRIRREQRLYKKSINHMSEEYNNFYSDVTNHYSAFTQLRDIGIKRTDSEVKMINGYQNEYRRVNNYCEVNDTYMVLDAGEYDIYPLVWMHNGSGADDTVLIWEDGYLDVSVTAQPLIDKDSFRGLGFNDGYTVAEKAKENARTLVPGEKVTGFCMGYYKLDKFNDTAGRRSVEAEQYYKLNVDRNSKISLSLNRVGGKPNLQRGRIYVTIMDMNGNIIQNQDIYAEECALKMTCDLEKGNYFVKVYSGNHGTQEYYLMYSDGSEASKPSKPTNPTEPSNPVTLSTPKLLTYKAGTKLIKGKSVPGTEVCITVEGKKYVVDAKGKTFKLLLKKPLKKGKIIKVYAKVGKIQSKTKTYRVK